MLFWQVGVVPAVVMVPTMVTMDHHPAWPIAIGIMTTVPKIATPAVVQHVRTGTWLLVGSIDVCHQQIRCVCLTPLFAFFVVGVDVNVISKRR